MNPTPQTEPVVSAEAEQPQVQHQEQPANLLDQIVDTTEEERRFAMDQRYATVLSKSGYFADSAQMAQALTKMMIAREMGVSPILNQKEIIIVKGRVSFSAELIDFLMKRAGYTWKLIELTTKAASIAPYFRGERITKEDGTPVVVSFTYEDAKTAGLTDPVGDKKQPSMYDKYGRNMLLSRCKTNMQRWFAPEVTKGMTVYSPDEIEEITAEDEAVARGYADGMEAATQSRADALKARLSQAKTESTGVA